MGTCWANARSPDHSGRAVGFDLPTSLAIIVFTSAVAGCLLLLSWLQHRTIFALALWGSAFIIAAIATALIIARGTLADRWSIVTGNAILAMAYGLIWSGVRSFEGKRVSVLLTLSGALLWLAACAIGPVYALPAARATVMAVSAIAHTLFAVLGLRRGRDDELARWPIILLLLGHAAAIPVRIPLAGSLTDPHPFQVNLLTFAIFETMFVCICAAYLFGSSCEGPNCGALPARLADRSADGGCEPSWFSSNGRTCRPYQICA